MTNSFEWVEYHYEGFADHDDPTKYENQVRQTGRFTATVWAFHLIIAPVLVLRTLDEIEMFAEALGIELTGEYRALTEIGVAEPRTQLTVYYRASRPFVAVTYGRALAREVLANRPETDYRVTPAGNWNDVLVDAQLPSGSPSYGVTAYPPAPDAQLPSKRGDDDGSGSRPGTEHEGQPRE